MTNRYYIHFALALALGLAPLFAAASEKKEEKKRAPLVELTDEELESVHALLKKLGEAFVTGDAAAAEPLLVHGTRRDKIIRNLKKEFSKISYQDFNILAPRADDTIAANRYSVAVPFEAKWVAREKQNNVEPQPQSNKRTETFVVRKKKDGTFLIENSVYFDSLGQQQGMGWIADLIIFIMTMLALMSFWIWMGSEAWWMRPRNAFWRMIVLIPFLGAFIFFFGKYLPIHWRREREAAAN